MRHRAANKLYVLLRFSIGDGGLDKSKRGWARTPPSESWAKNTIMTGCASTHESAHLRSMYSIVCGLAYTVRVLFIVLFYNDLYHVLRCSAVPGWLRGWRPLLSRPGVPHTHRSHPPGTCSTACTGTPVVEFIDPWLGDKVNPGLGLSYRHARLHGWRAGRSTLCRSWLYPPVRVLWIRQLDCSNTRLLYITLLSTSVPKSWARKWIIEEENRDCIYKLLRSPGIDSKLSIPPVEPGGQPYFYGS